MPDEKPKAIDLVDFEGKEGAARGIYELTDDTLKICSANPPKNKDRPKEFSSKKGSNQVLMEFKRIK
jgi:uncharacterized protein (TIGR03067 family)